MNALLLEHARKDWELRRGLCDLFDLVIVARLEPGLGGVYTSLVEGFELLRFGYPAKSPHPFFQVLNPEPGVETCTSIALGRTVFGRRIRHVIVPEVVTAPMVRHALAGQDILVWQGDAPVRPEDIRHDAGDADGAALLAAVRAHLAASPS